ncbi:MAG: trypsin-like serine protease [Solirubrobacteraceae bacterium]|jgi:secreted trypsin-like serine protease
MRLRCPTRAIGVTLLALAAAVALPGSAFAAGATATAGGGTGASRAHAAIVGGAPAASGTFPWLALVEYNEGNGEAQYCTGSVVASNVVLTAGHCVANIDTGVTLPASNFTVFTGNVDWTAPGEQSSAVTTVLAYPGYVPSTGYGDAGLLVLATPSSAPAIPLATAADANFIAEGNALTITGWGATSAGGGLMTALQTGIIGTQSPGYCESQDGADSLAFDPTAEFCAIDPTNYAIGTCHGDSGGPATVAPTPGSVLEVGIASRADAYCKTTVPDIFTRVDLVSGWVENEIAAVAPPPQPSSPTSTTTPTSPSAAAATTPPAPAAGKYLGTTGQRDGHVYATVGATGVTRINVRVTLRCGRQLRGPLTSTELFPDAAPLTRSGSLWRFSAAYRDPAGRRYTLSGAFPAAGVSAYATGTLKVTTRNGGCSSGSLRWSAPSPPS